MSDWKRMYHRVNSCTFLPTRALYSSVIGVVSSYQWNHCMPPPHGASQFPSAARQAVLNDELSELPSLYQVLAVL